MDQLFNNVSAYHDKVFKKDVMEEAREQNPPEHCQKMANRLAEEVGKSVVEPINKALLAKNVSYQAISDIFRSAKLEEKEVCECMVTGSNPDHHLCCRWR